MGFKNDRFVEFSNRSLRVSSIQMVCFFVFDMKIFRFILCTLFVLSIFEVFRILNGFDESTKDFHKIQLVICISIPRVTTKFIFVYSQREINRKCHDMVLTSWH